MTYAEAKQQRQEYLDALHDAEHKHGQQCERCQSAQSKVDDAYENYINAMAEQDAGEKTAKDVETAKQAYQTAKDEQEQSQLLRDKETASINLYKRKYEQAKERFRKVAESYWREQATPIVRSMIETLEQLEAVNDQIRDVSKQMEVDGFEPVKIVGSYFKNIQLPMPQLKRDVNIQKYRQHITENTGINV